MSEPDSVGTSQQLPTSCTTSFEDLAERLEVTRLGDVCRRLRRDIDADHKKLVERIQRIAHKPPMAYQHGKRMRIARRIQGLMDRERRLEKLIERITPKCDKTYIDGAEVLKGMAHQ